MTKRSGYRAAKGDHLKRGEKVPDGKSTSRRHCNARLQKKEVKKREGSGLVLAGVTGAQTKQKRDRGGEG